MGARGGGELKNEQGKRQFEVFLLLLFPFVSFLMGLSGRHICIDWYHSASGEGSSIPNYIIKCGKNYQPPKKLSFFKIFDKHFFWLRRISYLKTLRA
jgi:hypothetical protein